MADASGRVRQSLIGPWQKTKERRSGVAIRVENMKTFCSRREDVPREWDVHFMGIFDSDNTEEEGVQICLSSGLGIVGKWISRILGMVWGSKGAFIVLLCSSNCVNELLIEVYIINFVSKV